MKENGNSCIYGTNVVLLPYLPQHIPYRHRWLSAGAENRLDRSLTPPTIEEETKNQELYTNDATHAVFLVADAMLLGDPETSEADSLIGEAHLLLYRDQPEHANIEIMLVDRTVRRRALVCETLLLTIYFGATQAKLTRFSVLLDHGADTADNRLIFAARGDDEVPVVRRGSGKPTGVAGASTPPMQGSPKKAPKSASKRSSASKSGVDGAGASGSPGRPKNRLAKLGNLRESIKKAFSKRKTDYLGRLTRHLLKEDDGDHWPAELDFELVESARIELSLGPEAMKVLIAMVAYAKRLKYSSLISTGTVRSASVTRIDGRTLTLVPYSKEHVPIVHGWMQQPEVFTGFGVQPPTLEQEHIAQAMMEKDTKDCHAFVVCSKTAIGDDSCPVHAEGRAQIIVTAPGVAQAHIAIMNPDLELKAFMLREALLMLLMYVRMVVSVEQIWMLPAAAVRPTEDPKKELWSKRLDFALSSDGKKLSLEVESSPVKVALRRLCKGMVIREYHRDEVVYEDGSIT